MPRQMVTKVTLKNAPRFGRFRIHLTSQSIALTSENTSYNPSFVVVDDALNSGLVRR